MDAFKNKLRHTFIDEADQSLSDCERQFVAVLGCARAGSACPEELTEELFRLAHNLKGSAALAGYGDLSRFVNKIECLLAEIRDGACDERHAAELISSVERVRSYLRALKADLDAPFEGKAVGKSEPVSGNIVVPTVRIGMDRLDELVKRAGELVVLRSSFLHELELSRSIRAQILVRELDKIALEMQRQVMALRMAPIGPVFQAMERVVREVAATLGKSVQFEISGEETEVDRTILEKISDPLIHMMRNAVDHGIETPGERLASGKPSEGKISVSARQDGGNILIEVRDDGCGMDASRLIRRAIEKKILPEGSTISAQEAYGLIFASGFSIRTEVTDISGRGVGMDVVKTAVQQLRGAIQIQTEIGQGTCFKIQLPLSLALVDGMVVRSGEQRYVLPCSAVKETLIPQSPIDGEEIPVFRLGDLLGVRDSNTTPLGKSVAVVTRDRLERTVSVIVDEIIEQQPITVQPLDPQIEKTPWIMGGAILADGHPSLILNIHELLEKVS